MNEEFLISLASLQAYKLAVFGIIMFLTGIPAIQGKIKVNYTRKINHFVLILAPSLGHYLFDYDRSPFAYAIDSAFTIAFLFFFIKPIRERFYIPRVMFASMDRPEDRPRTLLWLSTQLIASYTVLYFLYILFDAHDARHLLRIPLIVAAFGDGLAEPVGVRFGRFSYATRALFSSKQYRRTLEGSAVVFLSGVAAVILEAGKLTETQFWILLLSLPAFMTLAEAKSPHTWDTPFLMISGGLLVYFVCLY